MSTREYNGHHRVAILKAIDEALEVSASGSNGLLSAKAIKKALEFLVEVKEHKDEYGKDEWYMDAQPMAWDQAKKALGV